MCTIQIGLILYHNSEEPSRKIHVSSCFIYSFPLKVKQAHKHALENTENNQRGNKNPNYFIIQRWSQWISFLLHNNQLHNLNSSWQQTSLFLFPGFAEVPSTQLYWLGLGSGWVVLGLLHLHVFFICLRPAATGRFFFSLRSQKGKRVSRTTRCLLRLLFYKDRPEGKWIIVI